MPWYVNDEGQRLWYEEQGSGPALVLLHGWCMSSVVWRFQLETLSRSFRVIAPDLAGHGKSEKAAGGYGFEGFSADIAALLRHLDLSGAILAGWSLGAQVALLACSRVRERLSGLVLISATPCFVAGDDFPHALEKAEVDGMAVKVRRNIARALNGFSQLMFAAGELADTALTDRVAALLASIPLPETDTALQTLQALAGADMRHLLSKIDLPTLIINGERDSICLPGASAYLARMIGSSSRIVFDACGHAPFLTRHEEFDQSIINFSRRTFEYGK